MIEVKGNDGTILRIHGADFSYGVACRLDEAELLLKSHKARRENQGEVSRGHLCGISVDQVQKRPAEGQRGCPSEGGCGCCRELSPEGRGCKSGVQ